MAGDCRLASHGNRKQQSRRSTRRAAAVPPTPPQVWGLSDASADRTGRPCGGRPG